MSNLQASSAASRSQSVSERVVSHLDRGLALPGDLYTDDDLFAQEMTGIFGRQWLYAGHVSQLPAAGDFITVEVGDESGIVVRGRDGEISGLLNVCRHRGARLVDEPCGNRRKLVCPYHQWAYDHDGTLKGAPRMPEGFDKDAYPLKRLHTAVWHGLVFVNFAAGPTEDLDGLLDEPFELMQPYDIAAAKIAHTETYDVAANWKLVWENSQECYHCNANHPEFIRTFDNASFAATTLAPERSYADDRRMQCGRFPLKAGAVSLTMTGQPASRRPLGAFADRAEPYTASVHLKPGFAAVFSPDYGVVVTDVPVDARTTRVRVQWLVHPDAEAGADYELDDLLRVWDQTNRQDWELCRSVQLGVQSAGFEPGPLSLDETSVAGFYYSYARMLGSAGL